MDWKHILISAFMQPSTAKLNRLWLWELQELRWNQEICSWRNLLRADRFHVFWTGLSPSVSLCLSISPPLFPGNSVEFPLVHSIGCGLFSQQWVPSSLVASSRLAEWLGEVWLVKACMAAVHFMYVSLPWKKSFKKKRKISSWYHHKIYLEGMGHGTIKDNFHLK